MGWLKNARRVAARHDRTVVSDLAFVQLAAIRLRIVNFINAG